MEQHDFNIVTDYCERHWKGITIWNGTEVNLQQKRLFIEQKFIILDTAEMLRQYTSFAIRTFLF